MSCLSPACRTCRLPQTATDLTFTSFHRARKRVLENLAGGDVVLTADELKAIAEVQEKYPVQGARYFSSESEMAKMDMGLWG